MKCISCSGETGLGKFCQYCGSEVPETSNGVVTITVKGDMNDICIKKGIATIQDTKIKGDMGKHTIETSQDVNLVIKGNMNKIKIDGVSYTVKDTGDMNEIKKK